MKKEVNDVKKVVADIVQGNIQSNPETAQLLGKIINDSQSYDINSNNANQQFGVVHQTNYTKPIEVEESLSIHEKEKQLIYKALEKHRGKRKNAAKELGISERTLYRKIHEYEIKE